MDTTMSYPDFILDLLKDPECHDSEHGRSCHFCGSAHGRYDEPLEHYIDCVWVIAVVRLGMILPEGHAIFEPTPDEPCEKCGWYYNSPDDWRGREMPPPASDELRLAHDTHIAEEHGITVEEYHAGPPGRSVYDIFDGPIAWHVRWGWYSIARSLPSFVNVERGGIEMVEPPDLSDEAIRNPDA